MIGPHLRWADLERKLPRVSNPLPKFNSARDGSPLFLIPLRHAAMSSDLRWQAAENSMSLSIDTSQTGKEKPG